jgi:hypothetical protein
MGAQWFVSIWPDAFKESVATDTQKRGPRGPCLAELVSEADLPARCAELFDNFLSTVEYDSSLTEKLFEHFSKAAIGPTGNVTPPVGGAKGAADEEEYDESEDLRTLWVDFDRQGKRHKPWREVCGESTQEYYLDLPPAAAGAPTALDTCKMFERFGGSPTIWYSNFRRDKRLSDRDRNHHEMKCLVEAVEVGGCFDQANVGGMVIFEVLLRRIAAMAAALSKGSENPDWSMAPHICGEVDPYSLLGPAKAEEVQRSATARLHLEALRQRLATNRTGAGGGTTEILGTSGALPTEAELVNALATGGLPSGAGGGQPSSKEKGAGGGKSRGRGGKGDKANAGAKK